MAKDKKKHDGPTRPKAKKMEQKEQKEEKTLDEKIQAGELRLEEVELLRLQKLMHQRNSLAQESEKLQEQAQNAATRSQRANEAFLEEVGKMKARYGLREEHDVVLADRPEAGMIFVNQQTVQQMELRRKIEEQSKEGKLETVEVDDGTSPEPATEKAQ